MPVLLIQCYIITQMNPSIAVTYGLIITIANGEVAALNRCLMHGDLPLGA